MKRIVAWMLVCILMIGLLSAAVYAAGVPSPDEKVEIVTDPTDRHERRASHGCHRNGGVPFRSVGRVQEGFCQIIARQAGRRPESEHLGRRSSLDSGWEASI